jgi:hypothetical protein
MLTQSSRNFIDWLDEMCNLLEKTNNPTTRKLERIIGAIDQTVSRDRRGSKFLIPYDNQFSFASINPDLKDDEEDRSLEHFAITSKDSILLMSDLTKRFPEFRVTRNVYDGGSQILFYPIDPKFEFRGLAFLNEKEPEQIEVSNLYSRSIAFLFGETLYQFRDGYHLRR